MPSYPDPNDNPACRCKGRPMGAFLCRSGHLTECHYPYECSVAGCCHLGGYGFNPEEVGVLDQLARERIAQGLLPPYGLDQAGNLTVAKPPEAP